MHITIVAGARPNFIKIAPLIDAIQEAKLAGREITYRLVHTGQHYDKLMSETFFEQLKIPKPNVNLASSGSTQAQQTASIMVAFEADLTENKSDLVLVVGDVTSTLACSIVARKLKVPVAHVEAGIRSGDMDMPEEINRIVTDSITNYFFTTSENANVNLLNSGIDEKKIFFVGNTMIDTLLKFEKSFIKPEFWNRFGLRPKDYIILTLHRPGNVDEVKKLKTLLYAIIEAAKGRKIVFPVHPRTKKLLSHMAGVEEFIHLTDPLGYLEFNYLVKNSLAVITDSGGITEETTVMSIPCMTLRNSTERPETVNIGTNVLLGDTIEKIKFAFEELFLGNWKKGQIPDLWDGKSGVRIINKILSIFKVE